MKFLLDTNACIALIKNKPPAVRTRFETALHSGSQILISAVAAFELWYGVAKSERQAANTNLLEAFFAGPVSLISFDDEDARIAGKIRADAEIAGKPIGAYDLLIAGQALRQKFTLITANAREFGRVKGLDWEDWAKS
ncbi:MAG: type II toxin-antitoxin system VapC family toxin [Candidatus Acidiferrales bacterium]